MSTHSTFSNEDAHYYEIETAAISVLYAILNLQDQMEVGTDQAIYRVHLGAMIALRDHLRELVETLTRYDPVKVGALLKRADHEFGIELDADFRAWLRGNLDGMHDVAISLGTLRTIQ